MKYMKKHGGVHTMKKGGMYDAIMKFMGGGNMEYMKEGGTDFGNLSVKAGIDKNPEVTYADKIAGAKMNEKGKGGRVYRMGGVNEMGHGGVNKYPHGGVHNPEKSSDDKVKSQFSEFLPSTKEGGIDIITKNQNFSDVDLRELDPGEDYIIMVDGKPTTSSFQDLGDLIRDHYGGDAKAQTDMLNLIMDRDVFQGKPTREFTFSEKDRQGQINYVMGMIQQMRDEVAKKNVIKDKDGKIVGYTDESEVSGGNTVERNPEYDPEAYKKIQIGDSYEGIGANVRGVSNKDTVKNLGELLNKAKAGEFVDPRLYKKGKQVDFPNSPLMGFDERSRSSGVRTMNPDLLPTEQDRFRARGNKEETAELNKVSKRFMDGLATYGRRPQTSQPEKAQQYELTPAEKKLLASFNR